jgi:DNA-directed RNA polymerase specialized sigma24 family protein
MRRVPESRVSAAVDGLARDDRQLLALLLVEHLTLSEASRVLHEPQRLVRRRAASALARLAQASGLVPSPRREVA